MAMLKVTVTIDADVKSRALQDVADGKAASVSAWLNSAARERMERDELDSVIAEIYAATGGPPTDDERAAMRAHAQKAVSYAAGA